MGGVMKGLNVKRKARGTKVVFFFIVYLLFVLPPVVGAADLKDIISSLYGGDGIDLVRNDHTGHFVVSSNAAINELSSAIIDGVRQFPVSSTVGGFTFQYDPDLDRFVRTTETLGPIFSERAQTIGKHKLNIGFSYTILNFDRFEGKNTSSIRLQASHSSDSTSGGCSCQDTDLVIIDIDLSVRTRVYSFYTTLGLTDHLDFALFVPLLTTDLEADAIASILDDSGLPDGTTHAFGGLGDNSTSSSNESASGIGDILLRLKYFLSEKDQYAFAGGLDIKLPTGDEDNLLGSGNTTLRPSFIFSKTMGHFTPHLNIGYEFDLDERDQDVLFYTGGFDVGNESITLAVDLIGREKIRTGGVGDTVVDGSIGVKYSPLKNFLVLANLQFPLNPNSGLRASVVPTFGIEQSF